MRIGICESVEHARTQLICWTEQYCNLYGCKPVMTTFGGVQDLIATMSMLRYDLILFSQDGPEGFLSARRLRDTDPQVKLVFLTDTPQYAVMGVRIHLTDYIVKPVEFKHIVRALQLAGVGRRG